MLRACLPAGFAVCALLASATGAAQDATAYANPGPPINARPGECYARVYTPPRFRSVDETVLRKAGSERIDVTPATYTWEEQQVLVKPASERVTQVIPAQYRWDEERVEVKPASEKIEQVPATYRTVSEQQLVKPAATVWKQGRGLVEKVDNITGAIMCLVEVPAEYRTVTRSEIDQPASVRRVAVPAEYQTVRRQVLVKDAEVRTEPVPAQYQTVKVRKLVTEASEHRVAVPAEYQTVTRQEKIADGHMQWQPVLCETNATPTAVRQLQQALKDAGYAPGAVDGHLGAGTLQAVRRYQADKGLPQGGVTLEVLESLGVPLKPPASAPSL